MSTYYDLSIALGRALTESEDDPAATGDILALLAASLRLDFTGYGPEFTEAQVLVFGAARLLDAANDELRRGA